MSSEWGDSDDVGLLLKEAHRLSRHVGAALARQVGLGAVDFEALEDLTVEGAIGPVELGRRQGLGPAASTALADRLERAGHVERRRHEGDRRRVELHTTEHAQTEALRVLEPLLRDLIALHASMSEDEAAAVRGYLRSMIALYRRHLGESGAVRP